MITKICKHFPGHLRNKEIWKFLKESNMKLDVNRLDAIIQGKVDP